METFEEFKKRIRSEEDIPNMSLYQLMVWANRENLDEVAIDVRGSFNGFEETFTITYRELIESILHNAKSLKELGIKEDEIVPLLVPNIPEARTLIYSNNVIGSTSYPMSPMMPVNNLGNIIYDNDIKRLFIFKDFYEKYKKALKSDNLKTIVLLDPFGNNVTETLKEDKRLMSWSEYMEIGKNRKEVTPIYKEDHTSVIVGTSGTTGIPKGVCLTDRNLNSSALSYITGKAFEGKTVLDALIPSIVYGLVMAHFETVAGKHVYLMPELLLGNTPQVMCKLKPDVFYGGPVHYINIEKSNEFKEGLMPERSIYLSGGATLPKQIESTLNNVESGYYENGNVNKDIIARPGLALSESAGLGSISIPGEYLFGSCGVPMPFVDIKVFKPNTDEVLGINEVGEICISGPNIMKEYLNNPAETEKVLKTHKDGKIWLHTQDIGYLTEDNHVFHVDRMKNIFMRTGFNVHPGKIAEFINSISVVKNSAVIGFKHPEEQMVPVAFVELNDEIGMTADEVINLLKEACYHNLEETSIPLDFVIVDSLPINPGGKIDGELLKKSSGIDYTKNNMSLKREIKFKNGNM